MKRNAYFLIIIALVLLVTVGCTSATALINGIVSSVEAVLPYITQLSPSDQALVSTYLTGVTKITDTLLNCSSSSVSLCIATASREFNTLLLPTLSASAPANVRELLAIVSVAIAAFVTFEGSSSVSTKSKVNITMSKRTEFKTRIAKMKNTLVLQSLRY